MSIVWAVTLVMAERTWSTAGAAGVRSAKTKYKYNINFNKNGFCCKSNLKPRTGTGLKQFLGDMAYRGGMFIYILTLLLLSLRCCWLGRAGGVAPGSVVVFAQLSHQAAYSNILSNRTANLPATVRPRSRMKSSSPNYKLTSYLLITILLAGDVHSNPGPVCKVERKPFLPDNVTPQLVNTTELHQGSDNRSVSPIATPQNTILNLSGCIHKEHLNRMTTKRKFELFQPLKYCGIKD